MTKAFLFLPLLILGCASKPLPVTYVHTTFNTITGEGSTTTGSVPDTACNRAEACSYVISGIWATQIGPVKVTPEQWRAAQGLYHFSPSFYNTLEGNRFVADWNLPLMPPQGKVIHATREQWQAAQGLYTWDIETSGKGFEVVDWDYLASKILKCRYEGRPIDCHGVMHADQGKIFDDEGEVSMMDTFPPSGDAK